MDNRKPVGPGDIAVADIVAAAGAAVTASAVAHGAAPPSNGPSGDVPTVGAVNRSGGKPRLQAVAMMLAAVVVLVLGTLTAVVGSAFLGIVGIAEEARNATMPRAGAQHRDALTAAELSRLAEVILNSRDHARRAAALDEAEALAGRFALVVDADVLDKLDRALSAVRRSNHRADLIDSLSASIREQLAGVDDALAGATALLAEPDKAVQDYAFLSNLYHLRRLYGQAAAGETAEQLALLDSEVMGLLRNQQALLDSLSSMRTGPAAQPNRLAILLDRFAAARTVIDLQRGRLSVLAQVRQDGDLVYRQLKTLADSLSSDAAATTLLMTDRIVADGWRGLWTGVAGIAAAILLLGIVTALLRRHVVAPVLRVSDTLHILQRSPQTVALPPASLEEFDRIGNAVERFAEAIGALHRQSAALRASEGRLNVILQSSPFPIVIVRGSDGRILFANASAAELLETTGAALLERAMPDFLEASADWQGFADGVFRRGRRPDVETRLRTAEGRPFWGVLSAMAMDHDGVESLFVTLHDISARKYAEKALVAAKEEAERALRDLRRTQRSLVQAEKLASLGALVAGVAHEINTPVGIGVTAASHLAEQARQFRTGLADGQLRRRDLEEFVDRIEEGTSIVLGNLERACALVQSFKQVAVDQTSEARRPFELRGYLDGVLGSLAPQLKGTGYRVTLDCPDGLIMDSYPGALSQVVSNLVINALLHAFRPGVPGTIAITIYITADTGGPSSAGAASVVLDVADDGRGIPPDQIERIFEPFFTTRRAEGGSGLGLHIVYNIVTGTLGGRIAVASQPGAGCRFTIHLPLTASPMAPPAVTAGRVTVEETEPA
ncbi:PAS domain-containing sensor histidine kinase (plasmid) [Azospirillum baldaniorum]|uniref:histidine kinase n=1 Tax=Azospirillum baldaniorum TaxID=1064539 RepID=A0A9P1JW56_9PROT|nr:ATP-binding protein [Azospirillum baldaniorum]AWJ92367.1 PAS domain-containing sensor histidine kinase [Azospirillum baldaniorum]TWA75859.1 PAS domain S-box-containing protein [Azospirillum brasilense]CCD00900.1 putative histidine kinase [Azospirillum baldaniorum]